MTPAGMRRVLVIGPSGAGKSTLARALHLKVGLPLAHLDQLFWRPGWVESTPAAFDEKLALALREPCWIIEGNYVRSLPERLRLADTVVWLDFDRVVCLRRAMWRTIRLYGRTRADMTPGCPERFDLEFLAYIWSFPSKQRPRIVAALEADGGNAEVIRLVSPQAAKRFLSSLK